jgi:hypothetical protein
MTITGGGQGHKVSMKSCPELMENGILLVELTVMIIMMMIIK